MSEIVDGLNGCGQGHLLRFMNELDAEGKRRYLAQLETLDLELLASLLETHVLRKPETVVAGKVEPPFSFPLEPVDNTMATFYGEAVERGRRLLAAGKVCALTVAGGQGSRLGFEGPKGAYPVTPVKKKTLFQYFAESLKRARSKFGGPIAWYIMTSSSNDAATRAFFEECGFFGLGADTVFFFSQGEMPAIGFDGRILMRSRDSLVMAPNGHGGTLLALRKSGALDRMASDGVEHISYFQVDNPLVSVVSPLFIGLHDLNKSEMSSRALIKTGPFEKLGNFCLVDGKLTIIEYSDISKELAEARGGDGELLFKLGSPAIHVLARGFVERLTRDGQLNLPWHRAEKKVPFIDDSGRLVEPTEPNAVKLETFIFDAIPMAENPVVLEARREEEFAPVKNKTGVDSAESCRSMMIARDIAWLEAVGVRVPKRADGTPDCVVELSPASFFDAEDVEARFGSDAPSMESRGEYYFE